MDTEPRESRRSSRIQPRPGGRRPLVAGLAAVAALGLGACSGDDGGSPPTEPPPEPPTGTVEVSAVTTGDTLDQDGYAVTLDGGDEQALDPDGTVTFEDVEEGDHEVELSGVQANCAPDGGATRTASVTEGETTSAEFDVACRPALLDRIVFDSDRLDGEFEIFVMAADGSDPTHVAGVAGGFDRHPSVSPDGTRLVFHSNPDASVDIFVADVDGGGVDNLTDAPGFDVAAAWSPDGDRIAFASNRDAGDQDIYVMNADGTGVTRLTDDPSSDSGPAWSPDGRRIAFLSGRDGGDSDVYMMDADGTEVTRLTDDPALDAQPDWSPDGQRIAFNSTRDGGDSDVYMMDADGTGVTRLTDHAADDFRPAVSPDGERVAFITDRDAQIEIYTVGSDGSGPLVNLTANGAVDARPNWTPARGEP